MKKLSVLFALAASPAFAAGDIPFFSLFNTNFVVLLAFIAFIAVLVVAKVPGMLGGQLDARAEGIRSELDEARALHEEAQTLLASYERKQEEVKEQATRIVAHAKMEAEEAYNKALADARTEAGQIVADAKAEIQADLDKAIAKADAEIAAKAAESEAAIAEIRAGAEAAVKDVAKDTAKEIIAAMGGKADARSVTSAVTARVKG